ncbi:hemolysin family protein [Desulfopila inferna]|uniref:hemolysin family protein n=1 Tax=Desulfopila inferna TaxID=468528 RepID=UPI001963EDAF|nr:hemolysin family protein [Desulfopila inferna]MBM9606608.1 HlyC/CorC family transporter [Desulfopila inferna]
MTEKETDPPSESSEPPSKKSIIKRIIELIPYGRSPDTKEALELEIQELLEDGEEQGLITSLEEKMISSIFDFRDTLAVEIMTPAAEMVSLEVSTSIADMAATVIEEGFTRIPIYQDNTDRIIGILHAKDLLRICTNPRKDDFNITEYLKPAEFVGEKKHIVDLLKEFQKRKTHMALVTDEFGAVRGLITLEDVLEEIVGEIDDEYDIEEFELEVIDDDTIRVQAKIDIEEVEEQFQTELPEGPYESVGGLVIHSLGRIGRTGDFVVLGDLKFTIKSASRRNVKIVEVSRMKGEQQE